jgi:hypothetical protein
MAGRAKIKLYEYSTDGEFMAEYESKQAVFNKFFQGKKRPLLNYGEEYMITPDGTILTEVRFGREAVLRIMRMRKSVYIPKRTLTDNNPVDVYNLKGEKIATFNSTYTAAVMTGIPRSSIESSLKAAPTVRKQFTKSLELIFKYSPKVVSL